jgi:hypothetical protein
MDLNHLFPTDEIGEHNHCSAMQTKLGEDFFLNVLKQE